MTRIVLIWVFGILAAGIAGAILGNHFDPYGLGAAEGLLAGASAFACFRLWKTTPQ